MGRIATLSLLIPANHCKIIKSKTWKKNALVDSRSLFTWLEEATKRECLLRLITQSLLFKGQFYSHDVGPCCVNCFSPIISATVALTVVLMTTICQSWGADLQNRFLPKGNCCLGKYSFGQQAFWQRPFCWQRLRRQLIEQQLITRLLF